MTVQQVIDLILNNATGAMRIAPTCDQLIVGDAGAEVTGIVTSFMATAEVIRHAKALGANFIITHEPTWFTGRDIPDWCAQDSVYLAKRRLIEETGVTIWRFHDHMHAAPGDLIYKGLYQKLGWQAYLSPATPPWICNIPATALSDLARSIKQALGIRALQTIGDPNLPVHRVLVLVGGGSLGLGEEQMPMEQMEQNHCDVMLCGDITEWTTCAYIRDAVQLGLPRAMLKLGHERSEEAGMEYMARWLPDLLPEAIPVTFVDAGEPFTYL